MNILSDLKYTLITPSRKRKYIFIGIGAFVSVTILIIVIASVSSSSSSSSSSSEPEKEMTPFESYINTKKYLYVWKYPNADNFIKFVVDHKFSKVFLYVGCLEWNYKDFINGEMHNAGDIDAKE